MLNVPKLNSLMKQIQQKVDNLKALHISDTHGYHHLFQAFPEDLDMIIHTGDCSNSFKSYQNEPEVRDFIEWYGSLKIPCKIFVAGNHDTTVERRIVTRKDFEDAGIVYLEDESVAVNEIKFYGTPYVPAFNGWAFMRARHRMDVVWNAVPEDTDVLLTHGAPQQILDLTINQQNQYEQVGCSAMRHRIDKLPNLKYILFGHIHDCKKCKNGGVMIRDGKTYSNGSVVKDGYFGFLTSNGNILNITK